MIRYWFIVVQFARMPLARTRFRHVAILVMWLVVGTTSAGIADDTPPNIVLILADDQGWWDLVIHGNRKIDTPNMDRIATGGVRFSRFYVQPVCGPTRSGLMTGRYFPRTGFWENRYGGDYIRPSEVTIAECLKQVRYRTAVFGKWYLGVHGGSRPNAQGFDQALTIPCGHAERYNYADQLVFNREPVETRGYITDLLTDAIIEVIQAEKNRPFFCYLPYNVPHESYKAGNGAVDLLEPGDKFIEKYLRRGLKHRDARIYAVIGRCDANIGRLLGMLEQRQLDDNTIVMFMSDNGGLSEHFRANLRRNKGSVNEGGILSPLFVRWPGQVPAGKNVDAMVSHVDILFTICELADAPLPDDRVIDSKSLASLMQDGQGESPHKYLYHTWGRHGIHHNKTWAILTSEYKLVNGKLYAINTDRGDMQNIAVKHPDMVSRLRAEYLRWFHEVNDGVIYEPIPVEIGRPDENPVQLDQAWARFQGDTVLFKFRGYDWDPIEGWQAKGERAFWKIDVKEPGRYAVQPSQSSTGSKLFQAEAIEVRGDELMRLNFVRLRHLSDLEVPRP